MFYTLVQLQVMWGRATKTIFYSLILVKLDGAYLRKYFLIPELPEPSLCYMDFPDEMMD